MVVLKKPLHPEIPVLLVCSALTLVAGLLMPVITIHQMVFWKDSFSVLTGIRALYTEGNVALAVIVFVFSVIFPIIKLATMFAVWLDRFSHKEKRKALAWIGYLGKWSMLDVFVVAITVVISKISSMMDAKAQIGIYVFAASIVMSIIASMRLERVNRAR
jgi:paraquat-inducible protein A